MEDIQKLYGPVTFTRTFDFKKRVLGKEILLKVEL